MGVPGQGSWGMDGVFDEGYDPEDIYRRDWEVSTGNDETVMVKGRLREHSQYWRDIGCNKTILDVIENGYRIPFLDNPPGIFLNNNRSARDHGDFVTKAIMELLNTGRVKEVQTPPLRRQSTLCEFEEWERKTDTRSKACQPVCFQAKN